MRDALLRDFACGMVVFDHRYVKASFSLQCVCKNSKQAYFGSRNVNFVKGADKSHTCGKWGSGSPSSKAFEVSTPSQHCP
jgi:hypothetical protein